MAKSAVLHRWMVVGKQYGAQSTPRHFGPQSLVSFVIWHMCDTRPHLAASTVESWSKKLSPNLFGLASVHSRPFFVENYQNDVLQFDFVLIFNVFSNSRSDWLKKKRAKTVKLSFFAACKQTKTFEKATAAFFVHLNLEKGKIDTAKKCHSHFASGFMDAPKDAIFSHQGLQPFTISTLVLLANMEIVLSSLLQTSSVTSAELLVAIHICWRLKSPKHFTLRETPRLWSLRNRQRQNDKSKENIPNSSFPDCLLTEDRQQF